MRLRIFAILFLTAPFLPAFAQRPDNPDAAGILLRLQKLNTFGAVLYLAAHPDDENTRLLAWLAQDRKYRTGYLSLTRGDGGQNLIGDEQGVELGLIRTEELLAARRIDGAEQFFATAYDFGFSKTTAEALRLWGREKILGDIVWVIRKFRPDVIITRFPEDARAGHGQHSASSVLAHEAFAAAADPNRFPEQLALGVTPWQARRLFWNTYSFGSVNTITPDQWHVDVGGYNPLTGKSYGEVAALSRSQHKSQGFGVALSRGEAQEYFTLTAGSAFGHDFMDSVDTGWSRLPGAGTAARIGDSLVRNFSPEHPDASVPALLRLRRNLLALAPGYWRDRKLAETRDLIADCLGLWLESTVESAYAAPGDSVSVTVSAINRSPVPVRLREVACAGRRVAEGGELADDRGLQRKFPLAIPRDQPLTQPYWLREPMLPGSFVVADPRMIGLARDPAVFETVFSLVVAGDTISFTRPLVYKSSDPVKGEQYQPFVVRPDLVASADPGLLFFGGKKEKRFVVLTDGMREGDSAAVRPAPAKGFRFAALPGGGFSVLPADEKNRMEVSRLFAVRPGGADSLWQMRTIDYPHIPRIDYFRPALLRLVSAGLSTEGREIGYIEGAGDKLVPALREMGYRVTVLGRADLTPARLAAFDAVITGVRAYDVHEWLFAKYAVLMQYVSNGGNLIVQYNRSNTPLARTHIGPYPFSIGPGRVTEEDAAVELLEPAHRALNRPNKIGAADFEGWVQERGIYFADNADSSYHRLLGMHDAGSPELKGGLITAAYGKGQFTYTGLVFFRELPAGVPGAYRLLANLIALNQH